LSRARPGALALLAVALAAIGFTAVHKQLRDGNDFPIYWEAARDLLAGRSPYVVGSGLHGYVYLPWFAWALAPLALLPLPAAAWAWYALNLCFLFDAIGSLLAALRAVGLAPGARALLAAALPLAGLAHDNLALGQANLFLLWLVAVAVRAAVGVPLGAGVAASPAVTPAAGRRPRRALSGIALGLAAALKMPAALLALPLVRHRRGRVAAGFAAGAALALAAPFVTLGPEGGGRLLGQWHAKVVAPAAGGTLQGSRVIDQSPHAGLRRLLVAAPAFGDTRVNVAALDAATFTRVSRGLSLLVLAAYAFVWLAAPSPAAPRALLLDLALGCCAMVQVTGFSLKAQFVVLLLPAWAAAALAWREPAPRGVRVLLVLAGVLFLPSYTDLVGRAASDWLLAHSSMAAGTLLLAVAITMLRFRVAAADARATPSPTAARTAAPGTGTAR
jgi:hypothetical protein